MTQASGRHAVAPRRARHRTGALTHGDPHEPAPTPAHGLHRAPARRVPGGAVLATVTAVALGAGGVATLTSTTVGSSRPLTTGDVPRAAVVPVPAPTATDPPRASASAPRIAPSPPSSTPPGTPSSTPSATRGAPPSLLAGLSDALFDAGTGDFADKFDNNGDSGLVERAGRPRVVANPDDPDRSAWRFSLGDGGKRSEVLPQGPGTRPDDGDVQWVRYSAILSDDFPTDTDEWQLILQWHHGGSSGSPPLALQVTRGQLMMVSEGDDMQPIGPVSPGQRVDLVMKVVFDQDPDRGSVTVWRDGAPTGVTGWRPDSGTMISESAYLKMGMYRTTRISQPSSITVTDLKIGPSERSVGGTGDLPARAATAR